MEVRDLLPRWLRLSWTQSPRIELQVISLGVSHFSWCILLCCSTIFRSCFVVFVNELMLCVCYGYILNVHAVFLFLINYVVFKLSTIYFVFAMVSFLMLLQWSFLNPICNVKVVYYFFCLNPSVVVGHILIFILSNESINPILSNGYHTVFNHHLLEGISPSNYQYSKPISISYTLTPCRSNYKAS